MYSSADFKKYTLMHKNIEVADISIDEVQGGIISIDSISTLEHFPISSLVSNQPDRKALNKWWTGRTIPASRDGLKPVLDKLGINSSKELIIKCLALSLSDQYWVKPKGSNIDWHDVNFFENSFSDDIGELLIGNEIDGDIDLFSPSNTSDGRLKKKWKIIDNERYLLKAGSEPFQQEPFNEQFASDLMERLGIPHVNYEVVWDRGAPYSCCKCFISPETEFVTADKFLQLEKKSNNHNIYQHFIYLCEKNDIKNAADFLDKMITVDFLIANEDRHLNNFGLIRNAETLKWIGFAPIFDNGTSLVFHSKANPNIVCKPFKDTHSEQLRLVTSFDWLDLSKLNTLSDEAHNNYSYLYDAGYITLERLRQISSTVKERVDTLEEHIQKQSLSQNIYAKFEEKTRKDPLDLTEQDRGKHI